MLHITLTTYLFSTPLLLALLWQKHFGAIFFNHLTITHVMNRNSCTEVSYEAFLKISQKPRENTCVRVSFYDAFQSDTRSCWSQLYPCRNTFQAFGNEWVEWVILNAAFEVTQKTTSYQILESSLGPYKTSMMRAYRC